jgi:Tfp pilus assembly protein PilO
MQMSRGKLEPRYIAENTLATLRKRVDEINAEVDALLKELPSRLEQIMEIEQSLAEDPRWKE